MVLGHEVLGRDTTGFMPVVLQFLPTGRTPTRTTRPLRRAPGLSGSPGWMFPSKICCESFQEAVRSGKPCDPRVDMDCDGKPNESDVTDTGWPVFDRFTTAKGVIDESNRFGDDPNFVPSPSDCSCKWELVKGRLDCSSDGRGRDFYHASWRCPSNGQTRETRKERPAVKAFPCPTQD